MDGVTEEIFRQILYQRHFATSYLGYRDMMDAANSCQTLQLKDAYSKDANFEGENRQISSPLLPYCVTCSSKYSITYHNAVRYSRNEWIVGHVTLLRAMCNVCVQL